MSFFQDFKVFAFRGNVIDLAVAVIIGTAFGKIAASLVSDVLMPPIGLLLGGMDFSALRFDLGNGAYISYGLFINTVINFLLVMLAIFLVVKIINRLKREEAVKDPDTKNCPHCLMTIPIRAGRCGHCTTAL